MSSLGRHLELGVANTALTLGEACGGTNWAVNHFKRMGKENNVSKVEPYDRGVMAARCGMSEDSNPFRPGTDEHADWLAGFEDFAEEDDFLDSDN